MAGTFDPLFDPANPAVNPKLTRDRQRAVLRRCGLPDNDDSILPEWGWSYWTPVLEKLLDRIEDLERRQRFNP